MMRMNKTEKKESISVAEAAMYLGICRKTVYDLIHADQLPHIKLGRRYLIPTRELRKWLSSQSKKQAKF